MALGVAFGGVLEFSGWQLSDACRHAELLGCRIRHAWFRGNTVCLRAEYGYRTADLVARDVIAGVLALGSPIRAVDDVFDGMEMSLGTCP